MKKSLTIGLAAAAGAAAVALLVSVGVSAGPLRDDARADNGATQTMPAHEIAAGVRAAGLDPKGTPELRGRYYAMHAIDRHGAEMRVLTDARFGDILSISPVRSAGTRRMAYNSGPRIIHVPQPDNDVATGSYRDTVNGDDASHVEDVADPEPPTPVRTRPAKRHRSAAPPPVKRHIVNSAPPPPPQAAADDKVRDQALTPVYPTPDYGVKTDSEKFAPPPRQN